MSSSLWDSQIAARRHAHTARRELVTAPGAPVVVPVDPDLRAHVSQALEDDDTTLEALELAAVQTVEQILGRTLLSSTWRVWFDAPFPGRVLLLPEPASAVSSVKVYSTADLESTVATTTYQTDLVSRPARLVLRDGQVWPLDLREANAIAVEYVAGYADAAAVPEAIKLAIRLLVGHWYDSPEAARERAYAPIAFGVDCLLGRYRVCAGLR